jgi:putative hemolysin
MMGVSETGKPRPIDERSRHLHLRLAETEAEVRASQALRYRVFVEEMAAKASPQMLAEQREFDNFDPYCDHMLIFDTSVAEGPGRVVGTYRLMRREQARLAGGFYTATEYDISRLLALPGDVMELGRSCVDRAYRTGANMQLLWRGLAAYAFHFDVDVLFGCGSLHGVDPEALALQLSYLYHHHLAPEELRVRALDERYLDMRQLPPEQVDVKVALQELPPLVKGYLRLGGFVGDGAVVDYEFNTTDVCVIVNPRTATEKYRRHLTRGHNEPVGGARDPES